MKKLALTFTTLCAFCAFAYAGPERYASKEVAPPPVVPSSCFDGWYFGLQGGGLLTSSDTETFAAEDTIGARGNGFFSDFESATNKDKATWEAGLYAGHNWQRGGWVFGVEIDISGTDWERKQSVFDFIQLPGGNSSEHIFTTAVDAKAALDWFGTGRVRVGHTLGDKFLVFVTGGGAVGLTDVSAVTAINENTRFGGAFSDQFVNGGNQIRVGWTAGGGFDFCLTEHWLLNFTYLYTDLGDRSAGKTLSFTSNEVDAGVRDFFSQTRISSDFKFHVFRAGLTFKF